MDRDPDPTLVDTLPDAPLDAGSQTIAIPRPALACYDLFCDATRVPEWMSVVSRAHVHLLTPSGRPYRVSFLARLQRATIGYTLSYTYRSDELEVSWTTVGATQLHIGGAAQFVPVGPATTLVSYELRLERGDGALPMWDDPFFEGHAASAVLSDFRDFALRTL